MKTANHILCKMAYLLHIFSRMSLFLHGRNVLSLKHFLHPHIGLELSSPRHVPPIPRPHQNLAGGSPLNVR